VTPRCGGRNLSSAAAPVASPLTAIGAETLRLSRVTVDRGSSAPQSDPEPWGGTRLEGDRRSLFEALSRTWPQLAEYYLGALAALDHQPNPDRLPQAAHSIRELIEKLPSAVGIGYQETGGSLKVRVQGLREGWTLARARSSSVDPRGWNGPIDSHLHRYLRSSDRFFAWFEKQHPTRAVETAKLLQAFGRDGAGLPAEQLEQVQVKSWASLRNYFQSTAHHKHTTAEEFTERLAEFERFILSLLTPRTFESFDALDDILQASEP
jgi:hypothetical protein